MKYLIKFKASGGDSDYTFEGFVIFDEYLLSEYNYILDNIINTDEYPDILHTDCDDYIPINLRDWAPSKHKDVREFLNIIPISEDEFSFFKKMFGTDYYEIVNYGEDNFWVTFFDSNFYYNSRKKSSGTLKYKKD